MPSLNRFFIVLLAGLLCGLSASGLAQSLGNAGTVSGVVSDPNGAVIAGATVVIQSRVTGVPALNDHRRGGVVPLLRRSAE